MATEIVPRWEWRTFGDDLGPARALLEARPPERTHTSDELYILSRRGDAPVKVRDGLMDVKHLQRVDEHGLELWLPAMKAGFPLAAKDVATVFAALGVEPPVFGRAAYALDEIREELVEPNPQLRAVEVHKQRAHYTVDECMVELTALRVDDRATKTLVVESPDPLRVTATLHTLGLDRRQNTNIVRGLKALLDFGARRFAVIDVGTNSVKFHLADLHADGELSRVVDRAEVTRLGEGLDATGALTRPAIDRTVDAIAQMVDDARREGAAGVVIVGTAGLRIAPNRSEAVDAVRARTGVTLEVISGEEEARLAYLAATSALPKMAGRLAVFDTGGGSSQFTFGQGGRVEEQFSLNVGAARYTDRYGLDHAVGEDVVASVLADLTSELARVGESAAPDAVVAMGGTVTNLAAVEHELARYDPDVVHGTRLELAAVDRQIARYRVLDADRRRAITGLQPARAEVILAGACIVRAILTQLRSDACTVSDRALRHGVLTERFAT